MNGAKRAASRRGGETPGADTTTPCQLVPTMAKGIRGWWAATGRHPESPRPAVTSLAHAPLPARKHEGCFSHHGHLGLRCPTVIAVAPLSVVESLASWSCSFCDRETGWQTGICDSRSAGKGHRAFPPFSQRIPSAVKTIQMRMGVGPVGQPGQGNVGHVGEEHLGRLRHLPAMLQRGECAGRSGLFEVAGQPLQDAPANRPGPA